MKKAGSNRLNVHIDVNHDGIGGVRLNDIDISRYVQGVEIRIKAGSPTEVRLLLPPCELTLQATVDAENLQSLFPSD